MQTILGANGVIGRELARRLLSYTDRIRLVSRAPKPVNPTDECWAADLLDAQATADAVAGSTIAYLLVGLPYRADIWRAQWPRIMRHAIDACTRHGTALVFFDNVYAYGQVDGLMTEHTPYNPCSRKGEVRAEVATMLMDEVRRGNLRGMIVRSADFYGPGAESSLTHATVTARLQAGKTPQWIGNPRAAHSFTFTADAGVSLARLGNMPEAYGQVWHALTSQEAMTGEQFVRIASELSGRRYAMQVAPRWMLRLMGLFSPLHQENLEMLYQFEQDYRFDSSKITSALGTRATPYRQGIGESLMLKTALHP